MKNLNRYGYISCVSIILLTLIAIRVHTPDNIEPEPELVFDSGMDSGWYQNDGEICLACYGVNLRCGDELTREDLLAMIQFSIDGKEWSFCEEEDKYHIRYRIQTYDLWPGADVEWHLTQQPKGEHNERTR